MDDCMNKKIENQKSSRRNRAVEVELDGPELSYDSGDGDGALVVMESSVVKKRKKKRNCTNNVKEKEESGECGVRDPLVVFGSDIMMMILSCLDARSVALSLLVSRGWHGVASSDTLWAPKVPTETLHLNLSLREHWPHVGTWHIDTWYTKPVQQAHSKRAYLGINRMITKDEYNTLISERLFKRGRKTNAYEGQTSAYTLAGLSSEYQELWLGKAHLPRLSQVEELSWLAAYSLSVMDGKRTRIMREDLWDHVWEFHFNKVAPEYWRNLDPYWKGTQPLMHRYFHPDGSQTADPGDKVWGGHEACYSIVTSFLADGKIREHYVRINRWPRLVITRKEDWSWEMSNNIYSYSSVPDAETKGGTGPYLTAY